MNGEQENAFPKERRSASAEAALRAEMRRVGKMTMEQRMNEALSLGKRLGGSSHAEKMPNKINSEKA